MHIICHVFFCLHTLDLLSDLQLRSHYIQYKDLLQTVQCSRKPYWVGSSPAMWPVAGDQVQQRWDVSSVGQLQPWDWGLFHKNCWETEVFFYLFSSPYVTRQHVRPVQRSIKILAVEELGGNNELQQKVQLRTRKNVIYVKVKLKKSRMLNRFAFLLWV